MKKIKNILFDLGGVIFPLSIQATIDAFVKHGATCYDNNFFQKQCSDANLDALFETGQCSAAEFRREFNKIFDCNIDDKTFDSCWNAMILGYPDINRNLLYELKRKEYNLYILSNINEIHVQYVEQLAQWPQDLFVKKYYSNEIHLAKPCKECYKYVINDSKIDPQETLYIDDRADNAETGRLMGFNTINLPQNGDLYKELLYLTK